MKTLETLLEELRSAQELLTAERNAYKKLQTSWDQSEDPAIALKRLQNAAVALSNATRAYQQAKFPGVKSRPLSVAALTR